MDSKVETSLFKILDIVKLLRDEQGTLGSVVRDELADMLVTRPTAIEVRAYLDRSDIDAGLKSIDDALVEFDGDDDAVYDLWSDVRHNEEPIAEFLRLWDDNGARVTSVRRRDGRPVPSSDMPRRS